MERALHTVRIHTEHEVASQDEFPGLSRAFLFALSESRKAQVSLVEVVRERKAIWNSAEGWTPSSPVPDYRDEG